MLRIAGIISLVENEAKASDHDQPSCDWCQGSTCDQGQCQNEG